MKTNDMLAVMDREQEMLTAENLHAAGAIMRQAAERLRVLAKRLRDAGMSAEAI